MLQEVVVDLLDTLELPDVPVSITDPLVLTGQQVFTRAESGELPVAPDNLVASTGLEFEYGEDGRLAKIAANGCLALSMPELARLIQSARLLVDEANANFDQTSSLIDQAGPFLEAQLRSGDDIRSMADGLARLTTEVANADPQLRSTLQTVPGTTEVANETFAGIRPPFPVLAANLANFGRIVLEALTIFFTNSFFAKKLSI